LRAAALVVPVAAIAMLGGCGKSDDASQRAADATAAPPSVVEQVTPPETAADAASQAENSTGTAACPAPWRHSS